MTGPLSGAPDAVAELRFVLPFPPSVNRYYRHVGYRTLLSREGRQYRAAVCALLAGRVGQPLSGPLEVRLDLYPRDRRRRDWDNFQKGIWDALQHAGVYSDDSQVRKATVALHDPAGTARAEVLVRPLSPLSTQELIMTDSSFAESDTVPQRLGLFLVYGRGQNLDLSRGDVSYVEFCCDGAKRRILEELDRQFEDWLYDSSRTKFEPQLRIEFRSVEKRQFHSALSGSPCDGIGCQRKESPLERRVA